MWAPQARQGEREHAGVVPPSSSLSEESKQQASTCFILLLGATGVLYSLYNVTVTGQNELWMCLALAAVRHRGAVFVGR